MAGARGDLDAMLKMNFWDAKWDLDEAQCPCDIHFNQWIEANKITRKTIYHFGTGTHHIVGLTQAANGSDNVVFAITASTIEYDAYIKLAMDRPQLMKSYLAYFGDGYQFKDVRHGRRVWVVPILGGEFVLDRRFGYREGLMGGNLWYFGRDLDSALAAAERGVEAIRRVPGVIMPFPGGIAGSGSKAGSRYSFSVASTYERYCPTLRERLGDKSGLPEGVGSVMEIIINGRDLASIVRATQAAIAAAVETPGLVRISAGNYGGRLGKSFIYLNPERQPAG